MAAILAIGCMGDAGPLQTRDGVFAWQDSLPAGATLHVRDMNGEIEVAPSADGVARVTADITWRRGDPDASLHFSGVRDGSDAVICAVWGKGRCDKEDYSSSFNFSKGDTDARVHFRIEVPAGVTLDLQGVNTDITAAASAPVRASTMNGDVTVVTAVGPVRGETKNGSVDIRMSSFAGTDSVIAATLNGDAYVYLPDGVDAVLDLAVTNGSVSSEFGAPASAAANRRSLRATLGAGTRTVKIRTINGSVA
ncbi:MAG: hypothetical protein OEW77_13395, partial [Gemmatimonadota bacterium]|nr:hypothetical protein [Gemmatimonadota bacterium]